MSRNLLTSLRTTITGHRSVPVRAVLSLGVIVGFGAVGTLAFWTDEASLTGGTFEAGNLDIDLSGAENNPAGFTSSFALSNMQPGHSRAAVVTVENDGTTDFTYTAFGTAPGALAPSLRFRVVPGGSVTGSGAAQTCTGGDATYDGRLNAGSRAIISGNRPLASGLDETVCVQAYIPTGTETGQGLSTTSSFVFKAKQVNAP